MYVKIQNESFNGSDRLTSSGGINDIPRVGGGFGGVQTPLEIPKALQNHAKFNLIVKNL